MRRLVLLAILPAMAGAEPRLQTLPYPDGVARPGPDVVYSAPETGFETHTVTSSGVERTYHAFDGSGGSEDAPAILLLHGASRDGRSMIDMWRATAETEGLRLLAPDSAGASWSPDADGPQLLVDVLTDAYARAPFSRERIYLFGHSSGAMLAQLYANRVNGPWRAVAAHGGTLDPALVSPNGVGTPILHVLGAQDHLFARAGAEASARALDAAGHPVTLRVIFEHDHWFYALGPRIAGMSVQFFEATE